MTSISYFRELMLSGRIKDIHEINLDKKKRPNVSFILSLKPDKTRVQTILLTTWETSCLDKEWFKPGTFIYIHAEWVTKKFYKAHYCSLDAYDCYRHFIEKVNKLDIRNDFQ